MYTHVRNMKASHSFRLVLLALFIHRGYQSQGSSGQRLFTKRSGFRNNGGNIASFPADSVISCSAACVNQAKCNSFNLGPVAGGADNGELCDLVKTDQHSLANITEAPGWALYLSEYHVVNNMLST